MTKSPIKLAIVGVGKIVRDQHLPSINTNTNFELVAAASRNSSIDGVENFATIDEMLAARTDLEAVALCMPPQYRYQAAHVALFNGLHVLLEKPPGATVSEVEQLAELANQNGVSLFATWHSRFSAGVDPAREFLSKVGIKSMRVIWKENVKKWHPGQEWIWQAGGLGVFDPGINGLSILSHILPEPAFVTRSRLLFPANKAAPIAAQMILQTASNLMIQVDFDWRQVGDEVWSIVVETDGGQVVLSAGGVALVINGEAQRLEESSEYADIYARFERLIRSKRSDVDLAPLKLTADAFLLGGREIIEPFEE